MDNSAVINSAIKCGHGSPVIERTRKEMSTSVIRCDEIPPPARPEGCLKPTLEVDGLVPAAVNSVQFFMGFSSALPGPFGAALTQGPS